MGAGIGSGKQKRADGGAEEIVPSRVHNRLK
jgi:hypothetical protein